MRYLFLLLGLLPAVALAIPEGPAYPSVEWTQREAANYAMVLEAPTEEVSNPVFLQRWLTQSAANMLSYTQRNLQDPSWLPLSSPPINALLGSLVNDPAQLNQAMQAAIIQIQADPSTALTLPLDLPVLPLCASWGLPCTGDPFRYPDSNGLDGDHFYQQEARVTAVVFYDAGCARISGRVWAPRDAGDGSKLPAVVIENGSVQAPETLYWWAAQALVRDGYVVMTFDPRGQGRSDLQTPDFQQGSNFNPSVFWFGLVDAIDFFRSTPQHPYPHNIECAATYPTQTAAFNPEHALIDPDRLGIAGHSLGAKGVSVVQGLGGAGASPWPGVMDQTNPVKVAVAWDGLAAPVGGAIGGAAGNLPDAGSVTSSATSSTPRYVPRVPAMGQSSEYGLTPIPFTQPPDPEGHKAAYDAWRDAGVPVYEFTIRGSTHYEWSLLPAFPATSWCPSVVKGQCQGGWGNPMARFYTLAWFDRWLKQPGEKGYADADARLLDDTDWADRYSFYFRSARSFTPREGKPVLCEDIRAGCTTGSDSNAAADARTDSTHTDAAGAAPELDRLSGGGGCTLAAGTRSNSLVLVLLLLIGAAVTRRWRKIQ